MQLNEKNLELNKSQLVEIDCRHLFFLNKTPVDLFTFSSHLEPIKKKNDLLEKEFFLNLVKNGQTTILVNKHYRHLINESVFNEITSLGRRIAQFKPLEFSKKIVHFISIQQLEILNTPLDEKLINNQMMAFKIWITFVKKLTTGQLQNVIKAIHQGPYDEHAKRNLLFATLLYKLSANENLFSEHYCFNLAISGLFSEIGASLLSTQQRKNKAFNNTRVFKYSGLILSIKTNLPPQNIEMITSAIENEEESLVIGQETYYFVSSYFLCLQVCSNKTFCLKKELGNLKNYLPKGHREEFKNFISRSMELFGWKQVLDHLTQ